jgi:hypothetical protein
MRLIKIKTAALAAALSLGLGGVAFAATAYSPLSGHPFANAALSGYTMPNGTVCFTSGRAWVIPVPAPVSSANVTYSLSGDYGNMQAIQAVSFNKGGTIFSTVNFSNFNASLVVPPRGTMYVKGTATTSTTLQACMRQVQLNN